MQSPQRGQNPKIRISQRLEQTQLTPQTLKSTFSSGFFSIHGVFHLCDSLHDSLHNPWSDGKSMDNAIIQVDMSTSLKGWEGLFIGYIDFLHKESMDNVKIPCHCGQCHISSRYIHASMDISTFYTKNMSIGEKSMDSVIKKSMDNPSFHWMHTGHIHGYLTYPQILCFKIYRFFTYPYILRIFYLSMDFLFFMLSMK